MLRVCLLLVLASAVFATDCDRSQQCRGPLRYYEQLKCEPIYANPGDCCAVAYDCSDFVGDARQKDKCYFGREEFAPGELVLTHSDARSCSHSRCAASLVRSEGMTFYFGGYIDCTATEVKEVPANCYRSYAHDKCCAEVKCLDRIEDRYKCEVDGKTYLDGEEFKPKSNPTLKCYCMEGYKGENVEPFCKNDVCGYEIDQNSQRYIRENCPPYYSAESSLADDCPIHLLCEHGGDVKILKKQSEEKSNDSKDNLVCNFNNRTMNVGDTLYYTRSRNTLYEEITKCECEVPPAPSCRRIPNEDPDSNNV